ncbi:MAG: hypothetical protein R3E90_04955 [Marinicella sp.]
MFQMYKYSSYAVVISFLLLLISFFKRNDFTSDLQVLAQLSQEPMQSLVEIPAFTTIYNEETFKVIPKYAYEIHGLVVSYRVHDSEYGQMIHALSKDHLNVADYCVVWGISADPEILHEFDFFNGQFTCNFSTHSESAWQAFNQFQLSNNHLLATDDDIRNTITDIKIGDQISIKGWLSHYIGPSGYERGSSTVRTDTGDGACETIFVNDIEILSSMQSKWRTLLSFSFGAFLISLFLFLKAPYRPHSN